MTTFTVPARKLRAALDTVVQSIDDGRGSRSAGEIGFNFDPGSGELAVMGIDQYTWTMEIVPHEGDGFAGDIPPDIARDILKVIPAPDPPDGESTTRMVSFELGEDSREVTISVLGTDRTVTFRFPYADTGLSDFRRMIANAVNEAKDFPAPAYVATEHTSRILGSLRERGPAADIGGRRDGASWSGREPSRPTSHPGRRVHERTRHTGQDSVRGHRWRGAGQGRGVDRGRRRGAHHRARWEDAGPPRR